MAAIGPPPVPTPQLDPHPLARQTPNSHWTEFWEPKFRFFYFRSTLFRLKNLLNFGTSNTLQIQKICVGTFSAPSLIILLDPFWHQFSLYFMTHRKLMVCNMYNAKCLFSLLEASRLGIKHPPQNHVFQDTSWTHFLLIW